MLDLKWHNFLSAATDAYLSLFSWTGNNPPRMTSPFILIPLGTMPPARGRNYAFLWVLHNRIRFFHVKYFLNVSESGKFIIYPTSQKHNVPDNMKIKKI